MKILAKKNFAMRSFQTDWRVEETGDFLVSGSLMEVGRDGEE